MWSLLLFDRLQIAGGLLLTYLFLQLIIGPQYLYGFLNGSETKIENHNLNSKGCNELLAYLKFPMVGRIYNVKILRQMSNIHMRCQKL